MEPQVTQHITIKLMAEQFKRDPSLNKLIEHSSVTIMVFIIWDKRFS